ncbi:MAG: hypothetical protein PHY93_06870 [Bacteriovorax sp.]|nr:hypothetical protein [Bacteriovorax sp.]
MITEFSQKFDGAINIITALAIIFYAVYMNFSEKNNGLRKRLLFLLTLLGSLCLIRGGNYVADFGPIVENFVLIIASIIPLSLFLLVELMLRRHLPLSMKLFAGITSLLLAVCLLIFGANKYLLFLLMSDYVLILLSIVGVLLTNKNLDLQKNELTLIKINTVIMILIIPLIVTDFKKVLGIDTIRLGAFGILFFLYALVKVWESIDVKGGFARLFYLLCFNLISAAIFCYLFEIYQYYFHVFIVFIMLRMLSDILIYTRDSYDKKAQELALSIMDVFIAGELKIDSIKKKISGNDFFILSKKELADYNSERIHFVFNERGLYFKSETTALTKDPDIRDEILHIYEDFDCNACIYVKLFNNDFFLILFKWPDMAPKSKLQKEIFLIQGLASQIKE